MSLQLAGEEGHAANGAPVLGAGAPVVSSAVASAEVGSGGGGAGAVPGDQPRVFFVHGSCANLRQFDQQHAWCRARGLPFVAFDALGCGDVRACSVVAFLACWLWTRLWR